MIGDKDNLEEDLAFFLVMAECELNRIVQPGPRTPYFMLPLPVELTERLFSSKDPFQAIMQGHSAEESGVIRYIYSHIEAAHAV